MTPGYYSRSLAGHRAAYLEFVTARFGGERVTAWQVLWQRAPVLFLMIEEHFALYVAASVWRSVLGRRTAGLLFRPGPASAGASVRLRFKRQLLLLLRALPNVRTLSIVPVPLQPQIARIVDGWVHDFQLWDMNDDDRRAFAGFRRQIEMGSSRDGLPSIAQEALEHARGRPLLVALGMQNRDKGVERLRASMRNGGCAGWAVLVAGRFAPSAHAAQQEIQDLGGHVIDRFIDDAELLALYAVADAVWCLYDPAYDQASGILGRALQLGVPPLVRHGSISMALCKGLGVSHASADGGADVGAALAHLHRAGVRARETSATPDFGSLSEETMREALQLALARQP